MCVLSYDSSDPTYITFLANPAGNIKLKIVSKHSNGLVIIRDDASTFITDANTGASVSRTVTAGTGFAFTVASGQTVNVNIAYTCTPPSAQGTLQEDCGAAGVVIDDVDGGSSGSNFIVKG